MVKRKKREEQTRDILSFLESEESGENHAELPRDTISAEGTVPRGLEAELLSLIKASGGMPKSRLWRWAKERKVRPVDLYRALQTLQMKGLVKRSFSSELEEIVYIAP